MQKLTEKTKTLRPSLMPTISIQNIVILEGGDVEAETGLPREQATALATRIETLKENVSPDCKKIIDSSSISKQMQYIRSRRRHELSLKRSNVAAVPIDRIKQQIKTEISGVLSSHNVEAHNKELLVEDIVYALQEFVSRARVAKSNCCGSLQQCNISPSQAEEMSRYLSRKAKSANKLNTTPKLCVTGKAIKLLERIVKRKIKLGTKTPFRTHAPLIMQFDVIRIPMNIILEVKNELKDTLRRSVNHIINDSPLTTSRKRILKNKLNDIVNEDIEDLVLTGKQSINLTRLKTLRQMNEVLLGAPIPKNKKNMFKYKLAEALSKNLNESLLLKTENYKMSLENKHDDDISSPESSLDIYYDAREQESSVLNKTNEGTATYERSKTKRYLIPNHSPVNNNNLYITASTFSNSENRLIFNNSVEQNSAFTSLSNPDIVSHEEEIQYTNQILNIVQNWLDAALITDLTTQQKNKVIAKLTQDIVDRKKYHQISKKAMTPTYTEDLEFLKLQIFRRLNKLMSMYAVKQIMNKTDQMLTSVDEIKVPTMTLPLGSSAVLASETLEKRKKETKPPKSSKIFKSILPQVDVNESLKEEINDVFTKEEIDPDKVKHIEDDIVSELQSIVVKGGDVESTKQNLIEKLMPEANLTREQANVVSGQLIDRAREMSIIAKATDSDLYNKIMKSSTSGRKRRLTEITDDEFINSPEQLHPKQRLYSIGGTHHNINDENVFDEILKKEYIKRRFKDLTSKLVIEVIDNSSISTQHKIDIKEKVLKNIDENINKLPLDSEQERIVLREKILADCLHLIEETMRVDHKNDLANKLRETLASNFEKNYNSIEETISRKPSPKVQLANESQSKMDKQIREVKSIDEYSIDGDQFIDSLSKLINDTIDASTISDPEKKYLKSNITAKLKEDLKNASTDSKTERDEVRDQILKDCNDIVYETSLPINEKQEIMYSLTDALTKHFEALEPSEKAVEHDRDSRPTSSMGTSDDKRPVYTMISRDNRGPSAVKSANKDGRRASPTRTSDNRLSSARRTSEDRASSAKRTSYDRKPSTDTKTSKGKRPSTEDGKRSSARKSVERSTSPKRTSEERSSRAKTTSYDRRPPNDIKMIEDKVSGAMQTSDDRRPLIDMEATEVDPTNTILKHTDSEEDPKSVETGIVYENKPDDKKTLKEKTNEVKEKNGTVDGNVINELENAIVSGDDDDKERQNFKDMLEKKTYLPDSLDDADTEENVLNKKIAKKEFKEALSKDIDDAIDKVSLTDEDQYNLIASLNNKLEEILNKTPFDGENDKDIIKEEIFKDGKEIINDTSLAEDKKRELETFLSDALLPYVELSYEMLINEENDGDIFEPDAASTPPRFSLATEVTQRPECQEYMDELKNCVNEWLETVPIHLEPEDQTTFTNELVKDLVDRLKYRKLSHDTFTKKDEKDNLKYQVFKLLSKVVDAGSLPLVMERTDSLYRRINEIPVPNTLPTVSYAGENG
uniref:SFRICE_007132 n=1 Tax=Spodoptera frugiperda TaxID=7108 RepID=A0A2H1VMD4_SPOFR